MSSLSEIHNQILTDPILWFPLTFLAITIYVAWIWLRSWLWLWMRPELRLEFFHQYAKLDSLAVKWQLVVLGPKMMMEVEKMKHPINTEKSSVLEELDL